ncbi:ArsR/SmtB family transcription factor [Belliella aquatica]|uniref:Transcriptional regulator n=1 Tax=Belliella aquatica TaxID=1323734 RepID=A0ABQ1MDK3_9BACT|nr:winged helix-turn-helix domain-containing protein [Belliella aquatica]MCH7406337.1 winged helix-turn-helix domain-containing protein [Belliella aquatica]GGC37946.1 transcriptional regulator [Belliella aquatica]
MEGIVNNVEVSIMEKRLAKYAKALGHPVRIQILNILNQQSCCFNGYLTEIIPFAKSTISQHLKSLKEAGLIQGEIMPPKIRYCLNKDSWEEAQQLFKNLFNSQKL